MLAAERTREFSVEAVIGGWGHAVKGESGRDSFLEDGL